MAFIETIANPSGACMIPIEGKTTPAGACYNYLPRVLVTIISRGPFNVEATRNPFGFLLSRPLQCWDNEFPKNLETKLPKKLSGNLGLNIEGPRPTITWNHNGSTLKGRGPQEPKIVTAVWMISFGLDRITSHQPPKWILICLDIEGAGLTITQIDPSRLY